MISGKARKALEKLVEGEVLFDELMKNHTSFRIGGPAEALIRVTSEANLRKLLSFCRKHVIPLVVIGNGTKLLVSDEGIDGVVAKISGCFNNVLVTGTTVKCGAGQSLRNLSRLMINHKLSGLEFAVGIPGTVGGAVVMNAGAHGSMMSDVITNVTLMDFEGHISKCQKTDIHFGYRQSKFQDNSCIILTAEMHLARNDTEIIKKRMNEYSDWRKKEQPQGMPSAGSVFKNPKDFSAGKLVDMAGLKGIRVGNAKISEKHANFILNLGNATAKDVMDLMKKAKEEVLRKSGIELIPEIKILGRFK